jgi:hypothetical protein
METMSTIELDISLFCGLLFLLLSAFPLQLYNGEHNYNRARHVFELEKQQETNKR